DEVRRAAYSLGRPLLWRREQAHAGALPDRFSLASTDDPSVLVETLKWAEDEEALIARVYEAAGGATTTVLRTDAAAQSVDQVDLLERNPRPVDGALPFRAREVKTVRIRV